MGAANCTCVKTINNDQIEMGGDPRHPYDGQNIMLNRSNEIMLLKKIIKIQALLRGWLERRKFQRIKIQAYNEKVNNILYDFSITHLGKFSKLPPYVFSDYSPAETQSDEFNNRFFKNPTLLENGAIYIGEW
jgi:hypothetical protein